MGLEFDWFIFKTDFRGPITGFLQRNLYFKAVSIKVKCRYIMKYFNILSCSALIFYGILGLTRASGYDPISEIEDKFPIYYVIYNYDENNDGNKLDEFKAKLDDAFKKKSADIDKGPYKRSPIHRAIEHMKPELVQWFIDNSAKIDYGVDSPDKIKSSRQMAGKPGHLVGHLEDYYHESKKEEAKAILTLLDNKGLNISIWPARTREFMELRDDWHKSFTSPKYESDKFVVAFDSLLDDTKSTTSSGSGSSGSSS